MVETHEDTSSNDNRYVVITGCSSGIGKETTLLLASQGFKVFATVRKEIDAKSLTSLNSRNIIPICPLDIAKTDDIERSVRIIEDELSRHGKKDIYALINNAGGGTPAPIEMIDIKQLETEVKARIVGTVALTQSLMPFIRNAGGRIIWIMTPAIIPTPYVTTIHACDFARNCIVRTLNIELKSWGIKNIMIKCGGIKTPAGMRTITDVESLLKNSKADTSTLYENSLRQWAREMGEFDQKRTEPIEVARKILTALKANNPKTRYYVGHLARLAQILEIMPQSLADWILSKRF